MDYEIHGDQNPRLRIFYLLIAAIFAVLICGLFYRQIITRGKYLEEERLQSQRRILLPGPRGNIYDRNGDLLVGNKPVFSVVVYLQELRSEFRKQYFNMVREERSKREKLEEQGAGADMQPIDRTFLQKEARRLVVQRYLDQVNTIIGEAGIVTSKDVERHFWQTLLLPMPLVNNVTPEQYARLVEQIPVESPILIHTDSSRYYPQGSVAAHTLGYVRNSYEEESANLPGQDLATFKIMGKRGMTGLEYHYNEHLRGESGYEIWVVDPFGYKYDKPTEKKQPVKGEDLHLTLDTRLQRIAEEYLGERKGAAVALDVRTGEVLCMASKPDYDLRNFIPFLSHKAADDINEREAWLNRSVQLPYPPGSTFKILTATAAFRHQAVDIDYTMNDRGSMRIGGRTFRNYAGRGYGTVGIHTAIQKSVNTYFYDIAMKLGPELLSAEARRFGFDQPTGIELSREETHSMNVPDAAWKKEKYLTGWTAGDTANTAIGQGGLGVTPLQMACFTASFARGETRTVPTLIRQPGKVPRTFHPGSEPIGLSQDHYQAILNAMESVVGPQGTAAKAMIEGLRTAGKTGTAQFYVQGKEYTLAWFICFAPVDNPEIAIAVMIEGAEPGDRLGGGSTAAPIARELLQSYFFGNREEGTPNGQQPILSQSQ